MKVADCPHYDLAREAAPVTDRCPQCGSRVALRACTACGNVGCCESQAAHAQAHAQAKDHPVIREVSSRGDGFLWCYACDDYLE